MKIASAEGEVDTNIVDPMDYILSNSGKMYEILYHSIYSDDVNAVVREICSNAFDAHTQAGCPEKQFRVILPNAFRPFFEVEDFGVGMSKADVDRIYRSYGGSTKAGTNSLVGGFGLGSKTPFAYGKTFNTRVRKDGIQCVFLNYIGEDGKPKLKMISETKTDQGNGVKVTVPVKPVDFDRFRRSASHYLSFYETRPEVIGNEFHFEISEADMKQLYKYGVAKFSQNFVVMGSVPYPIRGLDQSCSILLPIGFVQPVASRETLDLSDAEKVKSINELMAEKLTSARDSIANEYCSGKRLASTLSALRNSGSMRMLLNMGPNVVDYKSGTRFHAAVSSNRNGMQDLGVAVSAVASDKKIFVLYGSISSEYKRNSVIRFLAGTSKRGYSYSNPNRLIILKNLSARTIEVFKKVFPDNEIGVTWKTFEEAWEDVPKRKAPSVSYAGTCWVKTSRESEFHRMNVSDVDKSKCQVLFTKKWNGVGTRDIVRTVLSPNCVKISYPLVVANPTKSNKKWFDGAKSCEFDDWRVDLDEDILSATLAHDNINEDRIFLVENVVPLLTKYNRLTDSEREIVNDMEQLISVSKKTKFIQMHFLYNYTIKMRIRGLEDTYHKINKEIDAFDSWYHNQKALNPILKYVAMDKGCLKDIEYYLKRNQI